MNPELVTRNSLLRFFYFHEECHYKSLEWEIRPSAPSSTASLSQVFSVSLRCGALSIYRTSGLTWSALFISGNFLDFTGFYRVLPGFTGFYWVLLGFTGFSWVLLGFTESYWVILGFIGLYRALTGFTGFTGFYWIVMGFTRFYWVLLRFSSA